METIKYEELLDKLEEIIVIYNKETNEILYGNKSFEDFFGETIKTFKEKNKHLSDFFMETNQESYLKDLMDNGKIWLEHVLLNPSIQHKVIMSDTNDYKYHFYLYLKKVKTEGNLFMITFSNITEIISIQEELKLEKILLKEYKKIVDISTIVSKTDLKGNITYVNDQFCDITGYKRQELLGKSHNIVRHPDTDPDVFKELWKTIKQGGFFRGIIKNKKKNGEPYYVDATIAPLIDAEGNIKEYIGIRKDITEEFLLKEELKQKKEQVELQNIELLRLASVDSLTDSFNRRGLEDILNKEIKEHLTHNKELSIIMCDIDKFKNVNDKYGHLEGDELLTKFVEILKKNIKKKDTISRFGGEEFIIVLPETTKEAASKVAETLRKIIEKTEFNVIGHITASFGVSSFNELEKGLSIDAYIEDLTKEADRRLYEAKKQGRNRVISDF